jgi:hypothetical protein
VYFIGLKVVVCWGIVGFVVDCWCCWCKLGVEAYDGAGGWYGVFSYWVAGAAVGLCLLVGRLS